MRGLTAADFTLSVDGKLRTIDSVEYVDAGARGVARETEAASVPESAPQRLAGRHVVFVVDEGSIGAGGGKAAIAAAQRTLDRLGSTDRIALLSIPSGPAVDFTTERAPVRAALDRSVGRAARPMGPTAPPSRSATLRFKIWRPARTSCNSRHPMARSIRRS